MFETTKSRALIFSEPYLIFAQNIALGTKPGGHQGHGQFAIDTYR